MTLESVLAFLRRRWLPVVLCLIAGLAGGYAHTIFTPKEYRSSARVFVDVPTANDTLEALQGVQLTSQLIQSYADIITSHTAADRIRDQLGLPESAAQIAHKISATPEPNTLIIVVSATDARPARAKEIAQTAAVVLNDSVRTLEQNRTPTRAVQATIIDDASLPTSPISPQPVRDLVIGFVLGLLAGLALALAMDALDRTVKTADEGERLVGSPALAVVPRSRYARSLLQDSRQGSSAAEAYRSLRTALRFVELGDPARSLVVSSPASRDGKSTTAGNLAIALAQGGERVILVDADLRVAGLTKMFRLEGAPGLTDVITGAADLDDTLHDHRELLQVLPSGALPPNPSELLGSQQMASLIDALTSRCDTVILDAPPVLPVTDAVVLSSQVGGTLLVVRHGRTRRAAVAEATRRLAAVDAAVAGFVLNDRPRSLDEASYRAYAAPEIVPQRMAQG